MKVLTLNEGSRPGEIGYHFTNIKGLQSILETNFMKATNEPLTYKWQPRYKCIFPDNSELNISQKDNEILSDYFKCIREEMYDDEEEIYDEEDDAFYSSTETPDEILDKIKNNRLKEKIKEFCIESEDELEIEDYVYVPYKDLIGKPSWSYTRRPEGMGYRNFETFGENTVRIGIDIDKLTEKGYKIVPFSWTSQPKSGSHNEYEERVFGKGKREKGTSNFMDFVTEIAFISTTNINVIIRFDKLKPVLELQQYIPKMEELYKCNLTPDDLRYHKYEGLGRCAEIVNYYINTIKQKPIKTEKDLYDVDTTFDNLKKEILKLNSNINITYIDPATKKVSKNYQKEQVKAFLSELARFCKSPNKVKIFKFDSIILNNKECKENLAKMVSLAKNITSKFKYCQELADKCVKKYNEYYKDIDET